MFEQPHSHRHRRPAPAGEHAAIPPGDEPPAPSLAGDGHPAPAPAGPHPGPHGDGDGPRYVLLRSTDGGGFYLWCPVDRDPLTGAPIRQLIPVEPVAADARGLGRSAGVGADGELAELRRQVGELGRVLSRSAGVGADGELAELRRQVGELGLQVAALREQLAGVDALLGLSRLAEAQAPRAHAAGEPGRFDGALGHGAPEHDGRFDPRAPEFHARMGEPVDPRALASLLLQGKLPGAPRR